jgi:hypothetical protein
VETEGIETDDFIAMHYNPTMDIVVSNDKDFMQLGGRIYNWTKNEVIDVQDPMLHFWVQMLTGDRADNIPGVQNPEKAHHKNKPCFTTPTATEYLTSTPDRRSAVEAIYNKQFGRAWQVQFKLHGDLLWLQREVNDDFMNHI